MVLLDQCRDCLSGRLWKVRGVRLHELVILNGKPSFFAVQVILSSYEPANSTVVKYLECGFAFVNMGTYIARLLEIQNCVCFVWLVERHST